MPRRPATPEHRERERQRLRRAAAEIHAEEGLSALTVRRVTERAGVSPGSLYNSFANLHELVRSLWMGPLERAGDRLDEIAEEFDDPVDRLRAILEEFVRFAAQYPEVHRGVLLFVRPAAQPVPELREPEELPFFAHLRATIVEGQEAGVFRPGGADRLAQLMWSGIHGALALPINTEGYDLHDGAAVSADMVELLVRSLRPEPT